jgi:putative NADH-flavin reductase
MIREGLMAHVLIIGASRGIGLETTKQGLEQGHRVRALSRHADKIPINHPALEKTKADALNPHDMAQALEGVDVVIQCLGVDIGQAAGPMPIRLFSRSTKTLIEAMKHAGVRRLIAVTGYGAGDSRTRQSLPERIVSRGILGRAYDDKDRQELAIRHSGLDWVIVRPVILTPGPKTGRYQVLTHPDDWRPGIITRGDVADFLISLLDDHSFTGQTPLLTC